MHLHRISALALAFAALAVCPAMAGDRGISWTGCYAGLHIGFGGAPLTWTDEPPDTSEVMVDHMQKGVIGGAQGGCNYQIGKFVLGGEADFSGSGIEASTTSNLLDEPNTFKTGIDWLSTIDLRGGIALDRFLVFAKGGLAIAHFNYDWSHAEAGHTDTFATSETRTGWTLGGGLEYAISDNWTAKVQYDYIHFGSRLIDGTRIDGGIPEPETYQTTTHVSLVQIGVNYRF